MLSGVGKLGGGFESPVIGGAKEIAPRPHDPAKARKLLAEAGHPNGFETSFYVPTGRYLMDRQLGEAIQAQLAAGRHQGEDRVARMGRVRRDHRPEEGADVHHGQGQPDRRSRLHADADRDDATDA